MKNLLLVLTFLAVLGPAGTPVFAQSQSDLRRENQRLRTEVDDLGRELEALRAELQRLRDENEQLRRLLAAAQSGATSGQAPTVGSPPPPAAPAVSIDESSPDASPRALLRTLVETYQETLSEKPMGDSPGSSERVAYLRELDRWASRVNRDFKTRIEWYVEVIGLPVTAGRGFTLRLQAVDPVTAAVLGDPFDAFLPRNVANRLQQIDQRGGLDGPFVLKGVLVPRIHVNEDRTEPGPFDNPRFIGAFAEFGFTVDVLTLLPPKD